MQELKDKEIFSLFLMFFFLYAVLYQKNISFEYFFRKYIWPTPFIQLQRKR